MAENLRSLQWLTFGWDVASGLQPYPSLRHLEVTAEAEDLRVPLLPDLERLVIRNAEEDLVFDCTALHGMRNTQLDELGILCGNNTPRLYERIQAGVFSQLQILRVVDSFRDKELDYSRLPKLLRSKCHRLQTLVWDFQYIDFDEDAIDPSPLPNLSQLKGLINARLHRQLFFAGTTTTAFPALYNRLPPGLHHVKITGLVLSATVAADGDEEEDKDGEDEGVEDLANPTKEEAACEEEEQDGADLDMSGATLTLGVVDTRPASLQSMRLAFDFDVNRHTSLAHTLALAHPVLSALVESAERQDFSLGIYVRRIGGLDAEDEFHLGCETEDMSESIVSWSVWRY